MQGEKKKTCGSCGKDFSCYSGGCWCGSLPVILPLDPNKGCYCPTCLKEDIRVKTLEFVENQTPDKMEVVNKLGPVSQPVEGIDYYFNENGFYTMTGWFLLRRGICCDNNCKHCPY